MNKKSITSYTLNENEAEKRYLYIHYKKNSGVSRKKLKSVLKMHWEVMILQRDLRFVISVHNVAELNFE